ncbi:6-phosphogluconate dehydrogenase, decarboxylating 1 [Cyclospora cayetanensis]|uniref:phosphogluconate dehydrogenase (NADP(+)-dependent, decarboxylating) n=1 Tax=Cyclospora cayetanensis TaxID=88456 RepID=A0A6P6RVC6_9EIME|nr:6-phosphogluconate dehydrogenase, decarboxylating 1 [Cyclospora cayetanensis]
MSCDLGVYGLAVMGVNLALNAASKGYTVCVSNRSPSKVDTAIQRANEEGLTDKMVGVKDMKEFVENIKRPRRIVMLVQAGAPVDALIDGLLPLLSKGDILVDGGNEFYQNTEQRIARCKQHGILYMGMGVSGGEEGARHGPSLMPGGDKEAWHALKPILLPIAAQIDPSKAPTGPQPQFSEAQVQNACVAFLGPGGCGNFVKMVHNGIEYGDMQLIAEVYSVLRHCYGMTNSELGDLFSQWNQTELNSYLIEITSHIFKKKQGNEYLLDMILDTAGNKGTGRWTVQQAAEWGVPVPCLAAALDMRYISAHRGLRERLSSLYTQCMNPQGQNKEGQKMPPLGREVIFCSCQSLIDFVCLNSILTGCCCFAECISDDIKSSLYVAKICCYAQGLHLIATASKEKQWDLNLAEVSRIWKGGCIIRARFLNVMEKAFKENPQVENLLLVDRLAEGTKGRASVTAEGATGGSELYDEDKRGQRELLMLCECHFFFSIRTEVARHLPALRRVLDMALIQRPCAAPSCSSSALLLSLPALSAAYHYITAFTSASLPTNLIQAQRDCFGAHTFERKDKPGEKIHEKNWLA